MFPTALIDLHCVTLADYNYAKTGNPDTLDALLLGAYVSSVKFSKLVPFGRTYLIYS